MSKLELTDAIELINPNIELVEGYRHATYVSDTEQPARQWLIERALRGGFLDWLVLAFQSPKRGLF